MLLYRYVDNFSRYSTTSVIEEKIYEVVKETPQGYWIKRVSIVRDRIYSDYSEKRWIGKNSYKKFAFESKEAAMQNYRHRKRKHVAILEYKLNLVKMAYEQAKRRDITYDEKIEKRYSINSFDRTFYAKFPQFKKKGFIEEEEMMLS